MFVHREGSLNRVIKAELREVSHGCIIGPVS